MERLQNIKAELRKELAKDEVRKVIDTLLSVLKPTFRHYNAIIINKSAFERLEKEDLLKTNQKTPDDNTNKIIKNLLIIIDDLETYDFKNYIYAEPEISDIQRLVINLRNPLFERLEKMFSILGIILLVLGLPFLFFGTDIIYIIGIGIGIEVGGIAMIVISFWFLE